jgi:hypothetical protein
MKWIVALVVLAAFLPLFGAPSLHPQERELLLQMLESAELDSVSLTYEKDWDLSTKFKESGQLSELQNPWLAFEKVDSLRRILAPDSLFYWKQERMEALAELASAGSQPLDIELYKAELNRLWQSRVHQSRDIFGFVEDLLLDFSDDLKLALPFDNAVSDSLTSFFFKAFHESEDSLALGRFLDSRAYPREGSVAVLDWLPHLEKADLSALYAVFSRYQSFAELIRDKAAELQFQNPRPLRYQSRYGLMLIGSPNADHYPAEIKELCFLLEPGGDDLYELELYADHNKPFYLLIDLAGNDIYQNRAQAQQFSVCQGLGISLDLAGDDIYRGGDFAFSAGLGAVLHLDSSGEDIYDSGLFSQGAAFFGPAILCDLDGDDLYSATTMAQGMGSSRGFGMILDISGSDRYLLGRKFNHAPLMPNDYRSMGQGMGFGFRPDFAGGTGMIFDAAGNDKYMGGVYAQGVGYWYATGILIDESGNDVYNAVYYPQGSGIHLANGYLYDGGGDDAYYTRNGPGQGAGHDWGLGILLDKSGDDAYSIPGGNGLGLSNSVGVFVDSRGNDRYERKVDNAYGFGALSRRTGSIGLFLDAAGTDSYPDSIFTNNKLWNRGSYGIGYDLEHFVSAADLPPAIVDEALVDSLAAISEIFAAAAEWEVGSAIKRVRHARGVLIRRAEEAIPYITAEKLGSKSGLEYRAMEELIDNSGAFKEELFKWIEVSDTLKAKDALSLIAGTGDSLLLDPIQSLLSRDKYVGTCLGCLGAIDTDLSIDILQSWLDCPIERYRYIAARSLLGIGKPRALNLLRGMRGDKSFLIQSMVRSLPEDTSGE